MKIRQHRLMAIILFTLPVITLVNSAVASDIPSTTPTIFADMEEHAEDIVDTLLAKDEVASRSHYQQLSHEMNQLQLLVATNASDERRYRELLMAYSWMRVIDVEITDKSWVEAAIAANQLSGMIIQFTNFPTLKQRDTAWLDYLGREIELLTMEGSKANADLLSVRLFTLEHTWRRVSEEMIKHFSNKPLVLQGNRLVTNLKESKRPSETIALARQLLDFVDLVEKAK